MGVKHQSLQPRPLEQLQRAETIHSAIPRFSFLVEHSYKNRGVENNQSAVLFDQNGKSIAANVINNDGGNVIAAGGANVIAAGGANVIAAGGANLKDLPGASLGSNRQLMAGDKKIIKTSGSGAIIIR